MQYYLPPPDPARRRRQIPRLEPVGAVEEPLDPRLAHAAPGLPGGGRLVRVLTLDAGEAGAYLRRWAGEAPEASAIAAPPGFRAVERSRPEAGRVSVAGSPVVRRQRLAVAEGRGTAFAAHFSALEPMNEADQRAWNRLLDRIEREVSGHRSWRA